MKRALVGNRTYRNYETDPLTDHDVKVLRTRSVPSALYCRDNLSLPPWRRTNPLAPDTQRRDQSMDHNLRAWDTAALPPHMLRSGRSERGGAQGNSQTKAAVASANRPGKPTMHSRSSHQVTRKATSLPAGKPPRQRARAEEGSDATAVQQVPVPTSDEFPQWPANLFKSPKGTLNNAIQGQGRAQYISKALPGNEVSSTLTCLLEGAKFVTNGHGSDKVSWQYLQ